MPQGAAARPLQALPSTVAADSAEVMSLDDILRAISEPPEGLTVGSAGGLSLGAIASVKRMAKVLPMASPQSPVRI